MMPLINKNFICIFYSFWYTSSHFTNFSKCVSDHVEIHRHVLTFDKSFAHLVLEILT